VRNPFGSAVINLFTLILQVQSYCQNALFARKSVGYLLFYVSF